MLQTVINVIMLSIRGRGVNDLLKDVVSSKLVAIIIIYSFNVKLTDATLTQGT